MNNDNVIKLINENGVAKDYGRVPDLWHITEWVRRNAPEMMRLQADDILEVWHMAHDLKSVIEGQGQAKLVDPAPDGDKVKNHLDVTLEDLHRITGTHYENDEEIGGWHPDCNGGCAFDIYLIDSGQFVEKVYTSAAELAEFGYEVKS